MADLIAGMTPDEFFRRLAQASGGGGGGPRVRGGGASGGGATTEEEALKQRQKAAAEAMEDFQHTFQQVSMKGAQTSKMGAAASTLFNLKTTKSAEDSAKQMGRLNSAIYEAENALENHAGQYTASQRKEIETKLNTMKAEKLRSETLTQTAGLVSAGFQQLGSALIKQYQIEMAYQGQLLQLMSQGADGFQVLGASLENSVDKMNAANQSMAQMAQTAGSALGQMGGKFAPLAGLALSVLGQTTAAVSEAQAQLAKQGIRILMQEGTKLIKTYKDMAGAGVIFAGGVGEMSQSLAGTRLKFEDMAAVVNSNREAFARSGLGMAEATKRVGAVAKIFASTTGTFAAADKQMMALGFSYQEQAEAAADSLAALRKSGKPVTDNQVAEATKKYAENLALIASITGEDVKQKKKKIQDENANIAMQAKLADMYKQDPKKAKAFEDSLLAMDDVTRKAVRDTMIYGGVRDRDTAATLATNSGARKNVDAIVGMMKDGSISTEKVLKSNAKFSEETIRESLARGKDVGLSTSQSMAGLQSGLMTVLDAARKAGDPKAVQAAVDAIKKREAEAKNPKAPGADPMTAMMLEAQQIAADGSKKVQEVAMKQLPKFAEEMRKAYAEQVKALGTELPTSINDLTGTIEKLMTLLVGLSVLNNLGIFKGIKDKLGSMISKKPTELPGAPHAEVPHGTPGSPGGTPGGASAKPAMDADRLAKMKELRAKGMNPAEIQAEMKRTGGFKQMVSSESKIAEGLAKNAPKIAEEAVKDVSKLSKVTSFLKGGFEKVSKRLPMLGTALAIGTAGFQIFNTESRLAAGEITKEDARKEEGGIVGGAAGGLAGGLGGAALGAAIGTMILPGVGTAIGGLLGGAIGAWGGEELGAKLGESLAGSWDSIQKGFSTAGSYVAKVWDTTGNAINKGTTWMMTTVKDSANMLLGQFPVLNSIIQKFPNTFAEAGKMAKGFLNSVADKFAKEFPELTGMLKGTFETVTGSLGKLWSSISEGASDSWNWVKEKTGFGQKSENNGAATPSQLPQATAAATATATTTTRTYLKEKNGKIDTNMTLAQIQEQKKAVEQQLKGDSEMDKQLREAREMKLDLLNQAEKTGAYAKAAPATVTTVATATPVAPTSGPGTVNLTGDYKKNADSWVTAVQGGKPFDSVPEMYKPYVKAQLAKGTPKTTTTAVPTSPGVVPTAVSAAKSVPPTVVPTAQPLSEKEKNDPAAATAAASKHTNDLLMANHKTMEQLFRGMLQRLDELTGHAADTASSTKKTAQYVR